MKFYVVFILINFVPYSLSSSVLDKLFGKSNNNINIPIGEAVKVYTTSDCELNKVPPRISLAIVGGSRVRSQRTAPYVVALGIRENHDNDSVKWYCGGALISATTVVTAAHCINNKRPDVVRFGGTQLDSHSFTYATVKSCDLHPKYKFPRSYNDIAVVKLSNPVRQSKTVRPVCLAQDNSKSYVEQTAYVLGWGAEFVGGDRTDELLQAQVSIFSNRDCDRAYVNSSITPRNFPRGILAEQICAGSEFGGRDSCQGDSGGPLVTYNNKGITTLVGVVSAGAGCGSKEFPGVYTRISSYYDWLEQFI